MVVETMLKVLDKCWKVRTGEISWDNFSHCGPMGYYAGNVNIIYLLRNKVFIGNGTVCGPNKYELRQKLTSKNTKGVKFGIGPRFICEVPNKDLETFTKLLNYESNNIEGLKISTSYKDFLQNEVPGLLASCNEEVYHQYELKNVVYRVNKKGGIFVDMHFDNYYDYDEHAEFFIDDDAQKVIKQLDNWAYENEEINCDPKHLHRCKII